MNLVISTQNTSFIIIIFHKYSSLFSLLPVKYDFNCKLNLILEGILSFQLHFIFLLEVEAINSFVGRMPPMPIVFMLR
jgi:hypothetical protein